MANKDDHDAEVARRQAAIAETERLIAEAKEVSRILKAEEDRNKNR